MTYYAKVNERGLLAGLGNTPGRTHFSQPARRRHGRCVTP